MKQRIHDGPPPVPHSWVPGEGPDRCDCMIVGEAPGRQEWKAKRPFLEEAPAGALLRTELMACLTDPIRERIYITNVVKVFPPCDDKRENKKLAPTAAQIEAASQLLVAEIQHHRPRCVLALGKTAIKALTGSCRSIRHARAHPRDLAPRFGHSTNVIATYHPSYICCRPGGGARRSLFREDVCRFLTACNS